jgi:hypothetical protein
MAAEGSAKFMAHGYSTSNIETQQRQKNREWPHTEAEQIYKSCSEVTSGGMDGETPFVPEKQSTHAARHTHTTKHVLTRFLA